MRVHVEFDTQEAVSGVRRHCIGVPLWSGIMRGLQGLLQTHNPRLAPSLTSCVYFLPLSCLYFSLIVFQLLYKVCRQSFVFILLVFTYCTLQPLSRTFSRSPMPDVSLDLKMHLFSDAKCTTRTPTTGYFPVLSRTVTLSTMPMHTHQF